MALMLMSGRLKRSICLILLLFLICCSGPPSMAYAAGYGSNGYGLCSYGDCPTTTSTQNTLPSGLQVSINLVDGQIIPKGGYTIVVTPLNGQGTSFENAMIYINNALVQTIAPDDTGTAQWFWNPVTIPGTTVTIVVVGGMNNTTTQTFHVTIESPTKVTLQQTAKTQTPSGALSESIGNAVSQVYKSARYIVRALPQPVVYSFPYILFVLFGLNIFLLILQTQREVTAYHNLQVLLARQRNAAASKRTLVELLAHYFRTPLTILLGGVDLLGDRTSETTITLKQVGEKFRTTIERLLADIRLTSEPVLKTSSSDSAAAWRQPGLLIPLALIAAIVVPFNYVARNAGTLTITQTNLVVQGVVYTCLIVSGYFVFRWRQLYKRNIKQLNRAIAQEEATNQARDQVVTQATDTLQANIDTLNRVTAHLPPTQASTFILDGVQRFRALAVKLAAASRLQGAKSTEVPTPVNLDKLLDQAQESLRDTIANKHATITKDIADITPALTNPPLLTFVLRTIIDNSLAYSADHSTIGIVVERAKEHTVITISDNGSGIPAEKQQLLFQPFSKAEGAEVFNHEGMGFSLYLDKLIMNYLGGSISLTSKARHGTSVSITLP